MKKIILSLFFISSLFILSGCGEKKEVTQTESTKKGIPSADSGVVAPANLLKCDKDYTNEICSDERGAAFCDYYKEEFSDGTIKIDNLEWNNLCLYCKRYHDNGSYMAGKVKTTTLGYENKPCTQGMYGPRTD